MNVNEYLRAASGQDITAKDFRTWAATNLALLALNRLTEKKPSNTGLVQAIKEVARQLGNTPAVCRKSYIHPAVFEAYLQGGTADEVGIRGYRTLSLRDLGVRAKVLAIFARLALRIGSPPDVEDCGQAIDQDRCEK